MMLTRKSLLLAAVVVISGTQFGTELRANPPGVPVPSPPPLSCTTPTATINAVLGPAGEFPQTVACLDPGNVGKECGEYRYDIIPTGNIDHVAVGVDATQDLDSTDPSSPPTGVNPPGTGDNPSGFLERVQNAYAVTFNASASKKTTVAMSIVAPTSADHTTVVSRAGSKSIGSCLISGPGMGGDIFKTLPITQSVVCAGGKCTCDLTFDAGGNLIAVTSASPGCNVTGELVVTIDTGGGPEEVKNFESPITSGIGTCTTFPTKPKATQVCNP